jgi:hypothetical protein
VSSGAIGRPPTGPGRSAARLRTLHAHVPGDGVLAQVQRTSDVSVVLAGRDQPQHLDFAVGQHAPGRVPVLEQGRRVARVGGGAEAVEPSSSTAAGLSRPCRSRLMSCTHRWSGSRSVCSHCRRLLVADPKLPALRSYQLGSSITSTVQTSWRSAKPRSPRGVAPLPGRGRATLRATSGLAQGAVLAAPAGPRRPLLPGRAAPGLAPARSSDGGWPRQGARRRPRTGTPSRRSSRAARRAPAAFHLAGRGYPEYLSVVLLFVSDAFGEGGPLRPIQPHRSPLPIRVRGSMLPMGLTTAYWQRP